MCLRAPFLYFGRISLLKNLGRRCISLLTVEPNIATYLLSESPLLLGMGKLNSHLDVLAWNFELGAADAMKRDYREFILLVGGGRDSNTGVQGHCGRARAAPSGSGSGSGGSTSSSGLLCGVVHVCPHQTDFVMSLWLYFWKSLVSLPLPKLYLYGNFVSKIF